MLPAKCQYSFYLSSVWPLTLKPRAVVDLSCLCLQAYLEAFYKFCSSLGGTTADTMCPILEVSNTSAMKKILMGFFNCY